MELSHSEETQASIAALNLTVSALLRAIASPIPGAAAANLASTVELLAADMPFPDVAPDKTDAFRAAVVAQAQRIIEGARP